MFNVGVMVKVPLSGWWEGTYRRNSAKAETRIKTLEWQDAREKIELQVNQSVYRSSLIDAQIEVKLTEVYLSKALGKLSANE